MKEQWIYNGVEGIKKIARANGVKPAPLSYRVNDLGMTIEDAIAAAANDGRIFIYELDGIRGTLSRLCSETYCETHPNTVAGMLASGKGLRESLLNSKVNPNKREASLRAFERRELELEKLDPSKCNGSNPDRSRMCLFPDKMPQNWRLALGIGA